MNLNLLDTAAATALIVILVCLLSAVLIRWLASGGED
jgi:ABC-type Fe3+ transport system permease subunit